MKPKRQKKHTHRKVGFHDKNKHLMTENHNTTETVTETITINRGLLLKELFRMFGKWVVNSIIQLFKDYTFVFFVAAINVLFLYLLVAITKNDVVIYLSVLTFGLASLVFVSVESWDRFKNELKLMFSREKVAEVEI